MEIFFTILILILVVSLSGIVTRMLPFQIPLPLIQIALGALIAWPAFGLHVEFNPELFLVLFIPPLLFADGRKTPIREFLHHGREIIGLALVLVFFTVFGLGYVIHMLIPEMPLIVSFALAAVLSPTDAVALSGIVGKGRIPDSIMSILEGEALMNDASGLVSLNFAIRVAIGAMAFSTTTAGLEFVKVAAGGILIGIAVTWVYRWVLRAINHWVGDDPATQVVFLLLLPFAVYLVAEHFKTSGILAAVAAGMMVGNSKGLSNVPLAMRLRANSVWSMLEFVLNGTVFLMLGLQIPGIMATTMTTLDSEATLTAGKLFGDIILIYAVLMLMRFWWLLAMKIFSNKFLKKRPLLFSQYSVRECLIATFAGVRGAITLAGALSVPLWIRVDVEAFPARYLLIFLAMGVILFSLICGVIILPLLLRGLNMMDHSKLSEEEEKAKVAMSKIAVESLEKLQERLEKSSEEDIDPHLLAEIGSKVISDLRLHSEENKKEEMEQAEQLERRFRLTALRAQRGELYHMRAKQQISNETLDKLLYELDLMETLLIGQG